MSPIREENRSRYPADWPDIRTRILNRAQHRCEWCGVPNYAIGWRPSSGQFIPSTDPVGLGCANHQQAAMALAERGNSLVPTGQKAIMIVLTTAHINHQPEDNRDENLAALCQRCHNRHDVKDRRAGMRARKHEGQGDVFGAQE